MLGTLIKIRFQAIADSMFRSSRGKKVSAGMKVLAALLGIYVVAVFAALSYLMFAQLCEPFHLMGIDWFLFSFMILAAFCLMFIGSVFFAQSQMYEAKDNELLLSLPVPVSVILASRILTLYLMNLAYGAVTVIFLLIFLLLPLLAVAVSCLAGALLSALSGRIRRKSLVITLLYVAFLALYLYGYTKLMDGMNYLAAHGDTLADALRKTFLPLYQAGAAVADKDLFCFGMTLVYILVPFAVIYAVLSKSFLAIVTAQKNSAKRRYRQKTLHENSVVGALVKKEGLHFLSSPGYILNGAFGSAVLIAAAVFLAVRYIPWEKVFKTAKSQRIVSQIAGAGFGVYLMHMIVYRILEHLTGLGAHSYLWRFGMPFVIYFICVAAVLIVKKIPVLKHIVP